MTVPFGLFSATSWSILTDKKKSNGCEREAMGWKRLLASIVDHELLRRSEYLVTENRLLRNQVAPGPS